MRHRRFTDWVALRRPEWQFVEQAAEGPGATNDSNACVFVFERAA